ncbi:MAG: YHS domain-containing protein [Elusimicrobia bacterium]|nr:YHS domain-containing protein [Elusimicrobiota bacterium]
MLAGLIGLVGLDWARQGGGDKTAIDPVCAMEVRHGVADSVLHEGRRFYFCSSYCKDAFEKAPEAYRPADAPAEHTMRGIPTWMYQAGVGFIIVLSFGLFELLGRRSGRALEARFDLTRLPGVRAALKSPLMPALPRAVLAALFLAVVAAGLFGDQNPAMNIAPLLTWTVWWAGLIFLILFAGKAWCTVCPWDAVASATARFERLKLPWPRAARNIWPAVALFLALTWVELGAGITLIPRATAWVALAMLAMAVVSAVLFERKSFCRYGCLVGRVSGLYAMFSSLEVRAADAGTCAACRTQDCYRGNAKADGCPTFEFPRSMSLNTYCILCADCFKTCPHDNMALRLRPWGADLAVEGKPRADEAWLALVLLAMTGFHGLTMTPSWPRWVAGLQESWGVGYWTSFSLLMTLMLGLPAALYAVLVKAALARTPGASYGGVFVRYAYALLPIALFYHLAHNAEHFLMEGPKLLRLASDPFGWGWNLFGTAAWRPVPLITLEGLWGVQLALVVLGHVYSLWVTERAARRASPAGGFLPQLPMVTAMVAFSVFSLWLLRQPMQMRVSGM